MGQKQRILKRILNHKKSLKGKLSPPKRNVVMRGRPDGKGRGSDCGRCAAMGLADNGDPDNRNCVTNSRSLMLSEFAYIKALKKSLPLSSTRIKAGKATTSIFQTASIPSSGKSMHSTFLMFSSANSAAGPPMDPR